MRGLNKPAVSMHTRRVLRNLVGDGTLDEASVALMQRVLDKTRPTSASGWVFSLARALGAQAEQALAHASFCEMMCAAIDFIDDVQDGDAASYLGDVPPAVQTNLGVHMMVVSVVMANRLDEERGLTAPDGLAPVASRLLSRMGCGQRLELVRESWSVGDYERMCVLTGGCQLEIYFRAAARAADVDVAPWLSVTQPLGVLLHMMHDERVADRRLLSLPAPAVGDLRRRALSDLRAAMRGVPGPGQDVAQQLADYAGLPRQSRNGHRDAVVSGEATGASA